MTAARTCTIGLLLIIWTGASAKGLHFQKLSPKTAPAPRFDHAMAVDFKAKRVFLFGGRDAEQFHNDLWVFDAASKTWSEVEASGGPSARSGHSLAFDQKSGRLVLFGGFRADRLGQTSYLPELWFWSEQDGWRREFIKTGPEARAWHATAVVNGKMLLLGGYAKPPKHHATDVWSLDLAQLAWTRSATDGGPDMAGRPALLPLKEAGQFLVFGRDGVVGPKQSGLWQLDIAKDRWTRLQPKGLPPPDFNSCAADLRSGSILVLRARDPDLEREGFGIWVYSVAQKKWSSRVDSGGPSIQHGMVCSSDPAGDSRWICFGGVRRDQVSGETWVVGQ